MARVKRRISLGDRVWDLEIDRDGSRVDLWIDGSAHSFDLRTGLDDRHELRPRGQLDWAAVRGTIHRDGDQLWVHTDQTRVFTLERSRRAGTASPGSGSDQVVAPMTGTVRKIMVAVGDAVTARQPLVILEAMKMEHVLRAPRQGTIAAVAAVEGEQAESHAVLVRMTPETTAADS